MRSSERAAWALALLALPGCFTPIDLTGRSCPCDPGWVCDARRDECVPSERFDASGIDAGRDAPGPGSGDAPGLDAPGLDVPPTDAPEPDVGVGLDAPPDVPPPLRWCPDGAVLCDDFESDVANRVPPWMWATDDVRSTLRASRGVGSGRFAITDVSEGDEQIGLNVDVEPEDVYMRFWAFLPGTSEPRNVAIAVLNDGGPTFHNHSLIINDAGMAIYDSVAPAYFGTEPFPSDVWTCVVYHVRMGTPGLLEVSFGDSRVAGTADTRFPDGLSIIGLGITYVGAEQTTAFELGIDDVAITFDGTPLVCP